MADTDHRFGDADRLDALLRSCAGFRAEAQDGALGTVETPLFPPEGGAPDFLVLRVRDRLRQRRPVVSTVLVETVDPMGRVVRLHGLRDDLVRLPEHVPLASR